MYRIIAFIVLGVLFLCGSFVYLKYRAKLGVGTAPGAASDKENP